MEAVTQFVKSVGRASGRSVQFGNQKQQAHVKVRVLRVVLGTCGGSLLGSLSAKVNDIADYLAVLYST